MISVETWPILGAFLALQAAITFPLVKYIRLIHEAQLTQFKESIGERDQNIARLVTERDRFLDLLFEAQATTQAGVQAAESVTTLAERRRGGGAK